VPKHLHHACRFLQQNARISGYLAAIEQHLQLLREIRAALPPPLDEHCLHATLDAGVLALVTDSPVWSSRLRFFSPELKRHLIPHHGAIVACHIRVQPQADSTSIATLGKTPSNRLSPKTAQHLMDAAASIDDPRIAAALRRLAQNGTGNGTFQAP